MNTSDSLTNSTPDALTAPASKKQSLALQDLHDGGRLMVIAARSWVWSLSERHCLPCAVPGMFVRAGIAESYEDWLELMAYLRRFANTPLHFGPASANMLTRAEACLLSMLRALQKGYVGQAVALSSELVDAAKVSGLTQIADRLARCMQKAQLGVYEPFHPGADTEKYNNVLLFRPRQGVSC